MRRMVWFSFSLLLAACQPRSMNQGFESQSIAGSECVPGEVLKVDSPDDGYLNLRTPDTSSIVRRAYNGEEVLCAGTATKRDFALVQAEGCSPHCAAYKQYLTRKSTDRRFAQNPVDAAGSLQVLTVTTESWSSTSGVMRAFSRDSLGSQWKKTGFQVDVTIGHSGMAWGTGLHPAQAPLKKEGDGKSPAGIFSLGVAFGYGASVDTALNYLQMSDDHWCVDDSSLPQYNTIVRRSETPVGNSSERMRRSDVLYKYGIFVNHNVSGVPHGGSCVFIHVWHAQGSPTAGCTAMSESNLVSLFATLDAEKKPLLVVLPADTYQAKRDTWGLPRIW